MKIRNKHKRNQKLVQHVLERDFFTCQKCGCDAKELQLEVHHIQPLYLGGEDQIENMITLCLECHTYAPEDSSKFDDYYAKPFSKMTGVMIWSRSIQEGKQPDLNDIGETEWRINGSDFSKRAKVMNGKVIPKQAAVPRTIISHNNKTYEVIPFE